MEMQIAGDFYELWELRDIKKVPECRGCKCVSHVTILKHSMGSAGLLRAQAAATGDH